MVARCSSLWRMPILTHALTLASFRYNTPSKASVIDLAILAVSIIVLATISTAYPHLSATPISPSPRGQFRGRASRAAIATSFSNPRWRLHSDPLPPLRKFDLDRSPPSNSITHTRGVSVGFFASTSTTVAASVATAFIPMLHQCPPARLGARRGDDRVSARTNSQAGGY